MSLTADRFVAVKFPLQRISRTRRFHSNSVIPLVISTALLVCVPRLADYYWFFANDPGFGPMPKRPMVLEKLRTYYEWMLVIFIILFEWLSGKIFIISLQIMYVFLLLG